MLPVKDAESIMISSYPVVEDINYSTELELMEQVLSDIVNIRNMKATNNITKEAKIIIETNDDLLNIYISQLKIKNENIINNPLDLLNNNYTSKNINITYYYEGSKEDESKKQDEIIKLKASIERREKLLSNENYVNKAPASVVSNDKKKLEEEKEKLRLLEK
jgi:valyl-tRNA synthetase